MASALVDLIGNTPLIRLHSERAGLSAHVELYAKAEWFNPGGSVKDRTARSIVLDARARGVLGGGKRLLDATSGNTGIAYAMLGASMGFPVTLCVPANANVERKRTLRAYGAELVLTDPMESSDGAIREAQRLAQEHSDRYFYADQYNNPANWRAHYETTGPELVRQTEGRLTHFVVGLGTSGTCMGVGRYLREHLPFAQVLALQPDAPFHGLEGLKHMDSAIVPGIYDTRVPHAQRVCDAERAHATTRALARTEGLFVGISSGAAVATAIDLGRELSARGQAAVIVALCPDGGDRYLSESFWEEPQS